MCASPRQMPILFPHESGPQNSAKQNMYQPDITEPKPSILPAFPGFIWYCQFFAPGGICLILTHGKHILYIYDCGISNLISLKWLI